MRKATHAIILGLMALCFTGCGDTPYERGEIAALSALVAFDSPGDYEFLAETRDDIIDFLESGESLSPSLIELYAVKIAARNGKNPVVVGIILRKLRAELSLEKGENRAREFLRGLADGLSVGV